MSIHRQLQVLLLIPGIYVCPGNPDICDQEVRTFSQGGKLTAIKVEYTGYCGSMGPYLYPCSGKTCSDTNAEFRILDSKTYEWRNLGHPYACRLRLKTKHPSQFLPSE
jgi:hypothetical protein